MKWNTLNPYFLYLFFEKKGQEEIEALEKLLKENAKHIPPTAMKVLKTLWIWKQNNNNK